MGHHRFMPQSHMNAAAAAAATAGTAAARAIAATTRRRRQLRLDQPRVTSPAVAAVAAGAGLPANMKGTSSPPEIFTVTGA